MSDREFAPYVQEPPSSRKGYTPEEDERIVEAMQLANEVGIPLASVYSKLADELDRTARAIEVRWYNLKKKSRDEDEGTGNDDDDDDSGHESILDKLKALVKERDMYKARCELYEDKVMDYDRMARELKKIRRILGD